jgi:hypothetical protein
VRGEHEERLAEGSPALKQRALGGLPPRPKTECFPDAKAKEKQDAAPSSLPRGRWIGKGAGVFDHGRAGSRHRLVPINQAIKQSINFGRKGAAVPGPPPRRRARQR